MRVLLIHDYGTLSGGAEVMIGNIRDILRARGHEALLFTSTARPLPLPIVADETCFGSVSPLRRGLQAANPHAVLRLRRVLREFRPDAVLVKMFLTQISPLVLPLLRDVPSVLNVINYNLVCPLNTKTLPSGSPCHSAAGAICHSNGCIPWLGVARAALQRRLTDLSVFDQVLANSRWVAERLRADGVRVDGWIHNGVPQRGPRPPLGERPVIGYAGRLVPKKGVDVLLSAMAILNGRLATARLIIAGDGPERSRLEAMASTLGIRAAVDFRGHLDASDMESAMAPAWVQVVPSLWEEPFGIVAAEGMMRGTAVVASGAGGLTEQVVEGETGYLVPPGDPAALARALERILLDRDHAERLGAQGRRRALALFTFDAYVNRMLGVLQSLAVRSRLAPA
ncbi:MAG TPA: glycosyltransferase family 4 protein [Gemmatimonadota bacterium]|nr:glycosyltransferase family 4 protein [Gemmatimonadota bacterium]